MAAAARIWSGIVWAAGGAAFQSVIGLLSTLALARIIDPAAFGLAALAASAVALADAVCGGVLPDALRERKNLTSAHVNSTFWAGLIGSAMFIAALATFAGPATSLIGAPGSELLVIAAALGAPILLFSAIPFALLSRDLRFVDITRMNAFGALLAVICGLALAAAGAGVWSLILMELARRVVIAVAAMRTARWFPGLQGGPADFLELSKFNGQTLMVYGLSYLDAVLPRLLLSRLLGVDAVGVYVMAQKIVDALSQAVLGPFSSVIFSAAVRLRDDKAQLAAMLASLYRASGVLGYPAFLGLAVIAPIAAPLILGPEWAGASLAIQILILTGLRMTTGAFNAGVLRGTGHSGRFVLLLAAGVALHILLIPLAAQWGLAAVCIAIVARAWLTWPLGAIFIRDATGLAIVDQARAAGAAFPAALGMALGAYGILLALPSSVPASGHLAIVVCAGAASYAVLLSVLAPGLTRRVRRIAKAALRRDRAELARLMQWEDQIAETVPPSAKVRSA
jgi:O-antigen/teichoic acid export membrane protein